jgi:nucleoside transporter
MSTTIRIQLSILMFFQFVIWGAWFVTMGSYLPERMHASGVQVGLAYGNAWFGALVSPFFIGLIADRYFSAQKVIGVLHLLGAVFLYWLAQIEDLNLFLWVLLAYSCIFMPTLSLGNAVAMRQTDDAARDFPTLRVLGTIGWIIAGLFVNNYATTNLIFILPAIVSVVLGIYSFFLPDTPPKADQEHNSLGDIIGLDALQLFRDRSFTIFFIGAILLCVPLSFYYAFTNAYLTESGIENATSMMALLGQGGEIGFMLLLPFFLRRWGVKVILLVAMGAWVLRYVFLSIGTPELVLPLYLGVALHGICYDFFFVTGQIYTDSKAGERYKSAAQGLFSIATYGIGMTVGSYLGGLVAESYTVDGVRDWAGMWLVPAGIAGVILLAFLLLFRERK